MDNPIFVISLADQSARRRPLLKDLERSGLSAIVWEAIDGRIQIPNKFENLIDRHNARSPKGRSLLEPEFGASLSHRAIYEHIVRNNISEAIVFEDDAILAPDFKDAIRSSLPSGCHLLKFDYERCRVVRGTRLEAIGRFCTWKVATTPTHSTGYKLTNHAAKVLLESQTPVRAVADWPIDLFELSARVIWPRAVDHPPKDDPTSAIASSRNQLHHLERKTPARYFERKYWRRKLGKRIYPE